MRNIALLRYVLDRDMDDCCLIYKKWKCIEMIVTDDAGQLEKAILFLVKSFYRLLMETKVHNFARCVVWIRI